MRERWGGGGGEKVFVLIIMMSYLALLAIDFLRLRFVAILTRFRFHCKQTM